MFRSTCFLILIVFRTNFSHYFEMQEGLKGGESQHFISYFSTIILVYLLNPITLLKTPVSQQFKLGMNWIANDTFGLLLANKN